MDNKQSKDAGFSFLCSHEKAVKEGLYFPRRRVRTNGTDKSHIYKRIENQDFKDASEQEIRQKIEDCYKEMARQIKTFKRKYKKVENPVNSEDVNEESGPLSLYESTQKLIRKSCQPSDPNDHKDLLKNLCLVISEGRLQLGSSDFNAICKFVRESMPMHHIDDLYNKNNQENEEVKESFPQSNKSNTIQNNDDGRVRFNFTSKVCDLDTEKREQIASLNIISSLFHSNHS